MSKHLIGDRVTVWDMGETFEGTIHSVRKTIFGKLKDVVAKVVPNGFDPDGIGRERYQYHTYDEDYIIAPTKVKPGDVK